MTRHSSSAALKNEYPPPGDIRRGLRRRCSSSTYSTSSLHGKVSRYHLRHSTSSGNGCWLFNAKWMVESCHLWWLLNIVQSRRNLHQAFVLGEPDTHFKYLNAWHNWDEKEKFSGRYRYELQVFIFLLFRELMSERSHIRGTGRQGTQISFRYSAVFHFLVWQSRILAISRLGEPEHHGRRRLSDLSD